MTGWCILRKADTRSGPRSSVQCLSAPKKHEIEHNLQFNLAEETLHAACVEQTKVKQIIKKGIPNILGCAGIN